MFEQKENKKRYSMKGLGAKSDCTASANYQAKGVISVSTYLWKDSSNPSNDGKSRSAPYQGRGICRRVGSRKQVQGQGVKWFRERS